MRVVIPSCIHARELNAVRTLLQAADNESVNQGKAKKQESDKDAMKHLTLANSFLGLFRSDNEKEKPSKLEASRRIWSLPIPFWKRT